MESLFKRGFPCLPVPLLDDDLDASALAALSSATRDAIGAHNGSYMLRCSLTARRYDTHVASKESRVAVAELLFELALLQLLERMAATGKCAPVRVSASSMLQSGKTTVVVKACFVRPAGSSKAKRHLVDSMEGIFSNKALLKLGTFLHNVSDDEAQFRSLFGALLFATLFKDADWPKSLGDVSPRVLRDIRMDSPAAELARAIVCDLQMVERTLTDERAALLVMDMLVASVSQPVYLPLPQVKAFVGGDRQYTFFLFTPRPVLPNGQRRDAELEKRLFSLVHKSPVTLCAPKPRAVAKFDYERYKDHAIRSYKSSIIEVLDKSRAQPEEECVSDSDGSEASSEGDSDDEANDAAAPHAKRRRLDSPMYTSQFLVADARRCAALLVQRILGLDSKFVHQFLASLLPGAQSRSLPDDVARLRLRQGACPVRALLYECNLMACPWSTPQFSMRTRVAKRRTLYSNVCGSLTRMRRKHLASSQELLPGDCDNLRARLGNLLTLSALRSLLRVLSTRSAPPAPAHPFQRRQVSQKG